MGESYTVRIDAAGDEAELEVPEALVTALSEADDLPVDVVADLVVMSFAGRAHALLHHSEGEPADALQEAEAEMMDRFEERFGVTYAEATG
ncbi:MAG TPA: hypothetical protein VKA37_12495, partial [Halobacteriales archaeon]|nr:hypothetical protein [Halobacteriales archaeon]